MARGDYEGAETVLAGVLADARRGGAHMLEMIAIWDLSLVDYARGDLDGAHRRFEEQQAMMDAAGAKLPPRAMRPLFDILLAKGDLASARAVLDGCIAGQEREALFRHGMKLALARIERVEAQPERAEAHAHEALSWLVSAGARPGVAACLDELAGLAAQSESYAEAARLFGAADAILRETGCVRFVPDRKRVSSDVAVARAGLGDEAFDAAWAEGAALSVDEAYAYAVRGRGERKRPSSGWAGLTPTELEVARHVARGLSNKQIGEQMFVSASTVQTHLRHIFGKLGMRTRAEVAAEATRRGI